MHARVVLLGSALLIASCSLDRVSIGGGPGDAGGELDAGLVLDAGGDAASIDGSTEPDAGRDSGVVPGIDSGIDAGQDAGVDAGRDAGPPPRTCDEIYGAVVRSYQRCAETATECTFYTDPSPDASCDTVCALGRGVCIRAHSEGDSERCDHDSEADDCGTARQDSVCVCSRIP